ncbi:MAG: 50S ribosomal protein L29 [Candidatus Lloydbacteria bacterium]|nr:50S ribosomal protein L29 [Candidatus Lloydbacteria bacterium]
MAKTKQTDFQKKNDMDLKKELSENREGLRQFRFGVAGSKTKNVKESANRRKVIARILTELNTRKNKAK